ncbi:MAG TPA: metal ABC transporter permease [Nitrospiria bacterium]|nr:metal ABC transporter permease [Nitrospiria bacterium]
MIEMLALPFMRQAALACVLLAFVLAPLGAEVIRRRIVFVDLALAQIAALGAAIGTAVEWDPIATSLVFTVIGAALLSVPAATTRLPQEAVMGMVYAAASAAAVLIVAKTPHGDADFLHLLFGNILAVTDRQVIVLAGLAVVVAIWRLAARRSDPASIGRGATVVFYLLLGGAIAAAIRSAGVLMVFTYLVAPALAMRLVGLERGAGAAAVASAAACGVLGLWGSYRWDLPTGSSIVAMFGVGLIVTAFAASLRRRTGAGA